MADKRIPKSFDFVLVSEEASQAAGKLASRPESAATPVMGIDLGTTNSCCAVVVDGKPVVIPSGKGHTVIPSVVAIDPDGSAIIGDQAKAKMAINPQRTIYGSKRLIGRPYDSPVVRQVRDRFHYQIVPGPKNQAAVKVDERVFTLEEITAKILSELQAMTQVHLGREVNRAVITVPAYYNDNQRQAIREAGKLAGIEVERILNEPTAAAMAFGHQRGLEKQVLVFDLGGGTFDASVLNLFGDVYEVIATGGDPFLGGVDFDAQLMDYILLEFQLGLGKIPEMEHVAYLRALQAAEFAKCTLSDLSEFMVRLPFIGTVEDQPVDLEVKVRRDKFEELVTPLVRRTLDLCDSVLKDGDLESKSLDSILLVGGQTRTPLIRRMLEEHFGQEPSKSVHPDEAVAIGAALLGESFDKLDSVVLIDVLPVSIGVGVPGGRLNKILPSGTPVPASKTYALETYYDQQTEMAVPIFQGDQTEVDDNELIGTVRILGIQPEAKGKRSVLLTFALSPECLFSVYAVDRATGGPLDVVMDNQETMESLRKKTEGAKDFTDDEQTWFAEKEKE